MSSSEADRIVAYPDLDAADLHVDRIYAGMTRNGRSLDPMSKLFGVGVQGGIRFKGSAINNTVRLVVLFSTGDNPDWRDQMDPQTGMLSYYGDNRKPGKGLLETHLRGNIVLRNAFQASRRTEMDRRSVPPFFYFERVRKQGSLVRFRGLAAPGAQGMSDSEELAALWWSRAGQRFQNYCARFTILDAPTISQSWVKSLVSGEGALGEGCPEAWREWVESRTYRALTADATDLVRGIERQKISDVGGAEICAVIRDHFESSRGFELFSLAIWELMAAGSRNSPREQRIAMDRSAISGLYRIGPVGNQVGVEFVLESELGPVAGPITDLGRLLSRLRHREFGVFVTLSFFSEQVYRRVRDDSHPIALVCGKDVVETLRRNGFGDSASVKEWLKTEFPT